ncbi:DUF4180 domain-containing protein [Mangrovihabitans endophyticus]|uniref:DUF4180 domain-containing protein n=1 Tax=Mangrovihabitans endophyticus TaxID=1751298 RepID=A0A8J3BZE0_9ACTN|nr:DUF4180 domain-containing protein [Mangrovihabitans endophyticus]GGK93179.1 hypothetical protein GCM10012284_28920 [Mangrovihabitans endophyticus]
MPDHITERHGVPVLVCDAHGPLVAGPQDALDLIGATTGADIVALPAERLDDSFFALHTRVAGEIMQKFVNYHVRLAIIGDISAHVAASNALRDLIRESNRGRHVWFLANFDELDARLAGTSA